MHIRFELTHSCAHRTVLPSMANVTDDSASAMLQDQNTAFLPEHGSYAHFERRTCPPLLVTARPSRRALWLLNSCPPTPASLAGKQPRGPPLRAKHGESVVMSARAFRTRATRICERMSVLARCAVRASQPVAASIMMGTFSAEPMLSQRARMLIPSKCSLRAHGRSARED